MTSENIKRRWLDVYNKLEMIGESYKNSQSVAHGLLAFYDSLTPEEKKDSLPLLREWILSKNNKHQFDAEFIIRRRPIKALRSTIIEAIERSRKIPGPEAANRCEDLARILKKLEEE
jgi:hypothetical protein